MRVVDHVTSQQFMSCLGRLGLAATADEVALLRKKYDDRGDGTINYIDFTTAIDADLSASARDAAAPAAVARTAQSARIAKNGGFNARKTMEHMPGRSKQSATVPTLVSNKPPGTLEELMWRLQNKCIQFTIPVRDAFVDYDTNRKGAITVPQFRAALNRAFGGAYVRADVHEDELLTLERAYAAVMADGATFFRWRDFCKDLERAAVQPHLEANPDAPILTRRIERKAVALSDEEERRVAEILGAMRRRCSIRSIYPKQFFADFATSRGHAVAPPATAFELIPSHAQRCPEKTLLGLLPSQFQPCSLLLPPSSSSSPRAHPPAPPGRSGIPDGHRSRHQVAIRQGAIAAGSRALGRTDQSPREKVRRRRRGHDQLRRILLRRR